MADLPFYKRVSKVTFDHKTKNNPYKDQQWYESEINKPNDPMPTPVQVPKSVEVPKRKPLKNTNYQINRRKEQIVATLARKPMRTEEVDRAFGYAKRASYAMLKSLEQAGVISRRGSYWVSEKNPPTPLTPLTAPVPIASAKAIKKPTKGIKYGPGRITRTNGSSFSAARERVLETIYTANGAYLSHGDIADKSGLKRTSVGSALIQLGRYGYIVSVDGNWFLNPKKIKVANPVANQVASPEVVPYQGSTPPTPMPERAQSPKNSAIEQLAKDYVWSEGVDGMRLEAIKKFVEWSKDQ